MSDICKLNERSFYATTKKLEIPKPVGAFHLIGALEHYKQDYINQRSFGYKYLVNLADRIKI